MTEKKIKRGSIKEVQKRSQFIKKYKEKKKKGCILLYPQECVPEGKTLDDVVTMFTDNKTVIYKSSRIGIKPSLVGGSNIEKAKIKFVQYP